MTAVQRGHLADQLELWIGYAECAAAAGDTDEARRWVRRLEDAIAPCTKQQGVRIRAVRGFLALRGGL